MATSKGTAPGGSGLEVRVEARHLEAWKSLGIAYLTQPEEGSRFLIVSDEPPGFPGGEASAPPPLAFFTAGVAF